METLKRGYAMVKYIFLHISPLFTQNFFCPLKCPFNPYPGLHGSGKGNDTITSGFEGPWTTNPIRWDNEYFKVCLCSQIFTGTKMILFHVALFCFCMILEFTRVPMATV